MLRSEVTNANVACEFHVQASLARYTAAEHGIDTRQVLDLLDLDCVS